jgi:hypothetical protein
LLFIVGTISNVERGGVIVDSGIGIRDSLEAESSGRGD